MGKLIQLLAITIMFFSCQRNNSLTVNASSNNEKFFFTSWENAGRNFTTKDWHKRCAEFRKMGITEILLGSNAETIKELLPITKAYDVDLHAWMWTLNRPNDPISSQNPDWYSVNRKGQNSLEYRAYVDYYQWLSPFHPEAREHIKNNFRKLVDVTGLASIHLDYVRYVDVILGADLQPKYGLVQDCELPEYDFGYHPIAREGFKKIFGKDPLDMEHPELSTEWRQFRLNAVSSLVNELADIAHNKGQKITAAVFPFPEMSRQMVRQAWDDWNLDAVFPMLYHNFYRENINWIGFATEQGVRDVDFPVVSGLFIPAFKNAHELEEAIRLVKAKGGKGVAFFKATNMSSEMKSVVAKLNKEFNNK